MKTLCVNYYTPVLGNRQGKDTRKINTYLFLCYYSQSIVTKLKK